MIFKLSNLNSTPSLTLGYLSPALNNSELVFSYQFSLACASDQAALNLFWLGFDQSRLLLCWLV